MIRDDTPPFHASGGFWGGLYTRVFARKRAAMVHDGSYLPWRRGHRHAAESAASGGFG